MKVEYLKNQDNQQPADETKSKDLPKRYLKKREISQESKDIYVAKEALVDEDALGHFVKSELGLELEDGVTQRLSEIIKEICRHVSRDKNASQSILKVSDFT